MSTAGDSNSDQKSKVHKTAWGVGLYPSPPCLVNVSHVLVKKTVCAHSGQTPSPTVYHFASCRRWGKLQRNPFFAFYLRQHEDPSDLKKKILFLERCNLGSGSVFILRVRETQDYQNRVCTASAECKQKERHYPQIRARKSS